MNYCRKMTNLHEELFPNNPLEKKMDLHNNEVGMRLFSEMLAGIHRQFFETNFFVDKLFEKTKFALILEDLTDPLIDTLVYLKD